MKVEIKYMLDGELFYAYTSEPAAWLARREGMDVEVLELRLVRFEEQKLAKVS